MDANGKRKGEDEPDGASNPKSAATEENGVFAPPESPVAPPSVSSNSLEAVGEDLPPPYTWINTTPHTVMIFDKTGETRLATLQASKEHALRLKETPPGPEDQYTCSTSGTVLQRPPVYEGVDGVMPEDGVPIVVSMVVAEYMRKSGSKRRHVLTPASGPGAAVRDDAGVIVGTKSMVYWQ